jgi:hypothetical protein
MNCVEILPGPVQLAEPVLEQVVGAVEVGAQAPGRRRPVLARERLLAGGAEESRAAATRAREPGSGPLPQAKIILNRIVDRWARS